MIRSEKPQVEVWSALDNAVKYDVSPSCDLNAPRSDTAGTEVCVQTSIQLISIASLAYGWFPSHANEAMEINWMEVWTQTSVPAVLLLGAFKSQLVDMSYCVFCCCLTALSSASQTSTWGFSLLIIQWLLSGLIGVFLHVRCIPHQNSQRCFWASVWFMLDSSRWHEPPCRLSFGWTACRCAWLHPFFFVWIYTFELVIRLSKVNSWPFFGFHPVKCRLVEQRAAVPGFTFSFMKNQAIGHALGVVFLSFYGRWWGSIVHVIQGLTT